MRKIDTIIPVPSAQEIAEIRSRFSLSLNNLLTEINGNVSPALPSELLYGIVMGYFRGVGLSWKESFVMMGECMEMRKKPFIDLSDGTLGSRSSKRHNFKTEMITCSVGCKDYLEQFLRLNMRHFDHTIVVTNHNDKWSRKLAEQAGATVLVTDLFYNEGKTFDRGSVYNRALGLSRFNDWITFIDVDVFLLDQHRQNLEKVGLNNDMFYGMHRQNVINDEQRQRLYDGLMFESFLESQQEWGFGYFQMFNLGNKFLREKRATGQQIYPSANDVGTSDHLFRCQFGSGHYQDEKQIWHFDSSAQQRLNWPCYHLGADGAGHKSRTIHY